MEHCQTLAIFFSICSKQGPVLRINLVQQLHNPWKERALPLLELSRAIKDFLEALGAAAALVVTLMFCKFQGGP